MVAWIVMFFETIFILQTTNETCQTKISNWKLGRQDNKITSVSLTCFGIDYLLSYSHLLLQENWILIQFSTIIVHEQFLLYFN